MNLLFLVVQILGFISDYLGVFQNKKKHRLGAYSMIIGFVTGYTTAKSINFP